jgi:hypothetical protein
LNSVITPRARHEDDRGPLESASKLSHLTLVLRRSPEQRAALDRLLEELQDPSSPNFHQWQTPEQFGQRFTSTAVERVTIQFKGKQVRGFLADKGPRDGVSRIVDCSPEILRLLGAKTDDVVTVCIKPSEIVAVHERLAPARLR